MFSDTIWCIDVWAMNHLNDRHNGDVRARYELDLYLLAVSVNASAC